MSREKRKVKSLQDKKKAAIENEEAFSWAATIFTSFILLLPLTIGWFIMVNHIEAGSYGEGRLIEPFYSWVRSFGKVYWLIGITMLLGWSVCVKFIKNSEKQDRWAMPFLGITLILLGTGFTVAYMIALIKLQAVTWSILFASLLIVAMAGQTITAFFRNSWLHPLSWRAMVGFPLLSLLLLIMADHSEGLYTVVRRGGPMGNFSVKLLLWVISVIGTGMMIGMYEFILRKLTKK